MCIDELAIVRMTNDVLESTPVSGTRLWYILPVVIEPPSGTRLVSVRLTGFRSFRATQELPLAPSVTILAGRNNVGKTAFLHALTLPSVTRPGVAPATFALEMKWLIAGDELRTALAVQSWSAGPTTEPLRTANTVELTCDVRHPQDPRTLPHTPQAVPGDSILPRGHFEISAVQIDGGRLTLVRKGTANRQQPQGTFTWEDGTDPSLYAVSGLPGHVFNFCQQLFASFIYVGPRRTGSPRVPLASAAPLSADGANLTNVLAHLYNNERRTTWPLIEQFITEAFPEISHVETHLIEGNPPQAEAYIIYAGSPADEVPLEHCGTGIEQLLMLGAAILSSSSRRVFLIDEPHAFLHPHAERTLLRLMRAHPEHQYVVATHSSIFLRSVGLPQVLLVERTEQGSRIQRLDDERQLLDEIGLTANDVWSSEGILWVEGPTEVAIYQTLGRSDPELLEGVIVREMPEPVRAARAKPRAVAQLVETVKAVSEALSPFGVRARFLFDSDETAESRGAAVVRASNGVVMFEPCREVENLLLHAVSISRVLNRRRAARGLAPVPEEAVAARLDDLVGDTGNTLLYPAGVGAPDATKIRGSRVLRELFESWDNLVYDKVRDGRAIGAEVMTQAPEKLQPLRDAVMAVRAANPARSSRGSARESVS